MENKKSNYKLATLLSIVTSPDLDFDFIDEGSFNLYLKNLMDFKYGIGYYLYLDTMPDVNFSFFAKNERFERIIINLYEERSLGRDCKEKLISIYEIFNERVFKLTEFSHKNNIYFDCCSFTAFKNTFDLRYSQYENNFIDTEKLDFVKYEYKLILNAYKNVENCTFYNDKMQSIFKNSKEKKIEYLEEFLEKSNVDVKIFNNEISTNNHFHIEFMESKNDKLESDVPEIDLCGTSATEKIIYLQKLGIIDFLKAKQPFQSSTRSLASVLSAITGEKSGSILPMINPMLNKGTEQRNNPLNSEKTVSKVEQLLIKIGFNLNKTI